VVAGCDDLATSNDAPSSIHSLAYKSDCSRRAYSFHVGSACRSRCARAKTNGQYESQYWKVMKVRSSPTSAIQSSELPGRVTLVGSRFSHLAILRDSCLGKGMRSTRIRFPIRFDARIRVRLCVIGMTGTFCELYLVVGSQHYSR
jgi:hypothetical protein